MLERAGAGFHTMMRICSFTGYGGVSALHWRSPTPARVKRASKEVGSYVRTWRLLLGLTAQQVAERAGIDRGTLRRLETGDGGVSMDTLLNVARVLGQLDRLVEALDPYGTDLGRARADQVLPTRVRQ